MNKRYQNGFHSFKVIFLSSKIAVYTWINTINHLRCYSPVKLSNAWHPTANHIPSHSPEFKLGKPVMQVVPARFLVYYVNTGIHWYPEVARRSLIINFLRSGWLYNSLLLSLNLKMLTCNAKKSFLGLLPDINGYQCLHNKHLNVLVQPAYWPYSLHFSKWEGMR